MEIKRDSKFFSVPLVIDITLYRYNYIDNIIIGELKKDAFVMPVTSEKNRFSIRAEEFEKIITRKFFREINKFESTSNDVLYNKVNSIYFLNTIFKKYVNLEMINVYISNNRRFSRVFKLNDQNIIGFEYKIKQGILDYPLYLNSEQMERLNQLLLKIGIHKNRHKMDSYYIEKASNFINAVTSLEQIDPTFLEKCNDIVNITYELIEPKLEEDGTIIIIKTDFKI